MVLSSPIIVPKENSGCPQPLPVRAHHTAEPSPSHPQKDTSHQHDRESNPSRMQPSQEVQTSPLKKKEERHSRRRSSHLPRRNSMEASLSILSPELPGQFRKQTSTRTHLTASTAESNASSASNSSNELLRRREEEWNRAKEEEEEEEFYRKQLQETTFFIPGITGKARCLATPSPTKKMHSSRTNSPRERPRRSSTLSAARRTSPTLSEHVDEADEACKVFAEQALSAEENNSRTSFSTGDFSADSTNSGGSGLSEAEQLYDSVVGAIHTRRDEMGQKYGLKDDDFVRMMEELQKNQITTLEREKPSLRDQVDSIRDLLSDYYEQKKRFSKKRRNKMRQKAREQYEYTELDE